MSTTVEDKVKLKINITAERIMFLSGFEVDPCEAITGTPLNSDRILAYIENFSSVINNLNSEGKNITPAHPDSRQFLMYVHAKEGVDGVKQAAKELAQEHINAFTNDYIDAGFNKFFETCRYRRPDSEQRDKYAIPDSGQRDKKVESKKSGTSYQKPADEQVSKGKGR